MGHRHDWWEPVRHWLIPKLGVVSQFVEDATGRSYYVESETHANQFVGRVPMPEEQFEGVLHELGFERNPLSALKSRGSGEAEEGSWRKVGISGHPNMQIHIVLYDGDKMPDAGDSGYTYVYAHWEYRWDTHPLRHYRLEDYDADEGVKRMKKLLDERGISYEAIRP